MKDSPEILLQPLNPQRIERDDLLSLAGKIKTLDRDYDVRITTYEEPSEGSADATVDMWEQVLYLWLPATVGAAVLNQIVQLAFEWGKQRLRQPDSEDRPIRIEIVRHTNERGEVTEVLTITDADSLPEHQTTSENERYPMLKPEPKKDNPDS